MMKYYYRFFFIPALIFSIIIPEEILAQKKYTLSGYITDTRTGETMIGANVFPQKDPSRGTSSNTYGFYSIGLEEGVHIIVVSYLGYRDEIFEVNLNKDLQLNIKLSEGVIMDEVIISAEKEDRARNVSGTQMGTIDLPIENIKKLPAIFGEVDILKTIQLLPGVLASGEGNAGFYVRGGGPDQNLVLLDEAVVYNSGHLLGFFSVFNPDAIKNTTLIKGGMPAQYGGRLSSVLDIQMKEGSNKEYSAEGGIGIVASRLTVQGPVVEDKSSFMLSGRRTYLLDLMQPFLKGSNFEGTNYYFYDLNAKWNYKFSDKDRIYFSGYFGRDVLQFNQPRRDFSFTLPYGNSTATLRWNHLFSNKLFFNLSAVYNDYDFSFNGGQSDFRFGLFSGIRDYNLKLDFDYFLDNRHHIKYGAQYIYHKLTPSTASATNGEIDFGTDFLPKYANEISFYVQDDYKINDRLAINGGLRFNIFSQVGPYTSKLTGEEFGTFDPVVTYTGLEPRFSFKYSIDNSTSLKGGYTLTNQFLHLVTNSASTLPTDIWVPSTEVVRPQRGTQYALGIFKNFNNDDIETSFEVYYRNLSNQIDFGDDYVQDITKEVEDSFVFGRGRAYGAEFFVRKSRGRLNGWVGYTLSRSERTFPDIEEGRWFPAVYDRTHDLSIVANYQLNKKLEFGAVFIYGSGRLFTPVKGFFFIEQNVNLFYGPRNSERLDAYHRMDLSLTYTPNPDSKKKWKSSWNFSIYNVYNRKNPFFLNFETDVDFERGSTTITGTKVTIFPIIPSITYNFRFN